jgi:hypothetical protein
LGITGDHYVGTYLGHTIELVRDNWHKTLQLLIDGRQVASESRIIPHDIVLTATLEHDGEQHTVVARAIVHFPNADDTIEVDGQVLPITKTK